MWDLEFPRIRRIPPRILSQATGDDNDCFAKGEIYRYPRDNAAAHANYLAASGIRMGEPAVRPYTPL